MRQLALSVLLVAGCYSPNIPNGMQKCAAGNSCAAGYECAPDGFCYKKGQLPNGNSDGGGSGMDLSVACTQATCKAPTPICDPDSGQCVPCLTDVHCPDGKLCKMKACVSGCSMTHGCGDAGMCDPNGMCSSCMNDGQCGGNNPRCDTSSGRCVPCLPMNDNCTNGNFCKQVNGQYTCVMGCKVDLDCKPPMQDGGIVPKMVCCQNTCVDVNSDSANCGVCGKGCNGQTCCTGACTDTVADPTNCGGCGVTCAGKHANWACMASACKITMCQGSYADCNIDPTDGCEINTAADAMNCTGCGMRCNLPNAVAGCANGCFIQSCNMGFGNCDNMAPNGCESNVASDMNNCGMCGKKCAAPANGFPACSMSVCIVGGCFAGFDDCDMQFGNGCESKVDADPLNCGGCGMACPTPANAVRTCANNMCGFTCNAGFGNCDNMPGNGCEANTATNPDNCGVCGRVCSNANMASRTCGGGVCNGACAVNFADCNGNKQTDGCEVDLKNSNSNCNACGVVCMNGTVCKMGVCQMGFIPQLNGTNNQNVTRGSTHNSVFADPMNNKVYWMPGYTNGMTAIEFPDIANFVNNTNGRTINLGSPYEGTYHAALNGFFYYNTYNTGTIVKVRISDGALISSLAFPAAGHTNMSAFNWGGYSDMCFYVDAGSKLYMLWAPPGGNMQINQLDPNTLATLQNWTIPRLKSQTGFAFVVNGVFYIGNAYNLPAINGSFVLNGSIYNQAYVNSLTPQAGDYITDTYWNPGNNTLFEQTNGHTLIYPNVQ